MYDVNMCKFRAPCGLCTYYDKPCNDICLGKTQPKNTNICRSAKLDPKEQQYYCFSQKNTPICTCNGNAEKCHINKTTN